VRNLLSFVRRGAPDRVSTDLTAIVRAMVDLREYHLRQRNIAIDAQYAPEPLMAMVNRDEIQQLFLNLLLNAEHAIAGCGVPGTIKVTTGSARGRHFVEVADTGPGITPDLRGRIFEPFFTTKQVGEGTGLGLSISHGIAHAHGGSLDLLDSDRGARFRLTLPPVSEPLGEPAASTGTSRGAARAALVVDDEVPIRQLLTRLLERRGYTVHAADTGTSALRLAASNQFSLVICDVRMPGVSGIELHRRLQEEHGGSPRHFVFMTGDTTPVDALPLSDGQTSILPKPFTAADLDTLLAKIGLPRGLD
jgi:CheY-like chemotaxis protein